MQAGVSYAQHCRRSAGRPRLRRYTASREATPAGWRQGGREGGGQWDAGCGGRPRARLRLQAGGRQDTVHGSAPASQSSARASQLTSAEGVACQGDLEASFLAQLPQQGTKLATQEQRRTAHATVAVARQAPLAGAGPRLGICVAACLRGTAILQIRIESRACTAQSFVGPGLAQQPCWRAW